MRFSSLLLISGFSAVLAGCSSPSPMATGYIHHHGDHHVQPAPEPDSIGYEYSLPKNEEILEIWGLVAEDLLSMLEEQVSLDRNVFYLEYNPKTTFTRTFDHVLRQELTDRGYVLTNESLGAVELEYSAKAQSMPSEWEENEMLQDFQVVLTVNRPGADPESVEGIYKLPHYGYSSDRMKFLRAIGVEDLDYREPEYKGNL